MEDPKQGQGMYLRARVSLAANVTAIGTYCLLSEVTQERIWTDRARSIAHALHLSLPIDTLAERIALPHATAEGTLVSPSARSAGNPLSIPLAAPIDIDEATAVYFLWVRNLLHLRAYLVEEGEKAPDWMLDDAWDLYQWVRSIAWRGERVGFSPSLLSVGAAHEDVHPLSPLAEAVSAIEALGQTLEYLGGSEERLEQLSEDFAVTVTWADRYLRHAPGQWRPKTTPQTSGECRDQAVAPSAQEANEALYALLTPLMLVRLPLTPTIPVALAQGCVAAWGSRSEQG